VDTNISNDAIKEQRSIKDLSAMFRILPPSKLRVRIKLTFSMFHAANPSSQNRVCIPLRSTRYGVSALRGSPDHRQGWDVVIRLSPNASPAYLLKPSGLDPTKEYRIMFDSTGASETANGRQIAQRGLRIQPVNGSVLELVLFKAQGTP
jgi:hypothetical protein